jgi:hypothetical protein
VHASAGDWRDGPLTALAWRWALEVVSMAVSVPEEHAGCLGQNFSQ